LLLCRVAQATRPAFLGEHVHLIDSFEGLSEPTDEDTLDEQGNRIEYRNFQAAFACPAEQVRNSLAEFPAVTIHKGWIPGVFGELPETAWSFVHLDVDLYQPTLDSLAYFYPRMVTGGIIINDDYSNTLFPGCGAAWRRLSEDAGLEYSELDSGQAVLIRR